MKRKIAEVIQKPSSTLKRCTWCTSSELYQKYHDEEWGVVLRDDKKLFELLILESFQAGLSWITVLNKRESFRAAFDNFDYKLIANYKEDKIAELLENPGIIRHKAKINAAVTNANSFMKVQKEVGSFSKYFWDFSGGEPVPRDTKSNERITTTALSDKISKDMKKRGFKFVGSTTIYAYMQAAGMVNDHSKECFKYNE